ncbi:CheR family methyltransferase [Mucilaginibacter galii]|uniref:protein-glutamate O-methyltransferase n=1 Tax=Mucilaginibacter galii TaxID=2005073 RepID=A0A917J5N2_9SPHI|nr:CheR family methyltransferase [Mucilaginibacter galii]GGI49134.1 chemotaxis protein CheR [Mucilaginibacter galii]
MSKRSNDSAKLQKSRSFPVVCLGGSAGAFAAFEKFFTHMPSDSGMAFVIVMHLDPNHKGQIAELIRNFTSMPVHEALDGVQIEPNHIYIIPPNKDIGIHNRKLLLLNITKPHGYRQPIDYFLQSLADDQWNKAVGIIFSGMGSDGETGVRMIKEKLGMVMVQDPETAQYNSMPLAAIDTNLADYVLAPEEMPIKLIQYLNHPVLTEDPSDQARSEIRNAHSVQKILMLLRSHTGHDFSLYKKSTILRRIDRRVAYHQLPDYVQYVNYLRENPQEIDVLFNELLIGVTKFFRDSAAHDALKIKLGGLIRNKENSEPIRVWIAGCSTGEEAYSVAMVIIEILDSWPQKKLPKVQIFATDLDADAIEHARTGVYHSNIVADVTPERLERFFTYTDASYTIKKDLREMIVFAQHNLIKDAPFTKLDLLCCRNVMIYLTTELQKKIIPVFHYALRNKGLMFLGPAETIGGFTDMFVSVEPKWKIFEAKEGKPAINKMIDFPFHVARQPTSILRIEDNEKSMPKLPIVEAYNKILLEYYTPASVLINDKGDILFTNGKTGRYLELPSGEAVMNVHKMAREELKYVLGNIIHQARTQKTPIKVNNIKIKDGSQTRLVNLQAALMNESALSSLMLIAFEDMGMVKKASRRTDSENSLPDKAVGDLEKELFYTKQQLHSTIEQMETSLEELKSTNEELQSTNEELQSTNEESLTTKEEMQSLNEELMTVNMQYQSKAEELTRLNNDMKNLLDSTEIGTIFLNNDLEILRYTPQISKLFNIIPIDVGRSLSHVVSNFDYDVLESNILEVIDRLLIKEIEIKTKANDWYRVRIMPYRTLDNFISGAVLTFTLITSYKEMEYELKALKKYTTGMINKTDQPTVILNWKLDILNVNHSFEQAFHINDYTEGQLNFIQFAENTWKDALLPAVLEQWSAGKNTPPVIVNNRGVNYQITAEHIGEENVNERQLILVTIKQQ